MFKMRFIAANKAIGWLILAIILSIATISMLDSLDTAWLRFLVVMTLTKIIFHCVYKAKWNWGIYVNKKLNNMFINQLHSEMKQYESDIILHYDIYSVPVEDHDTNDIDIERSVYNAMDKWLQSRANINSYYKKQNTIDVIDNKEE